MTLKFKENRVWRAYTGGMKLDRFAGKTNCVNGRFPEEWIASVVVAVNPDRVGIIEGISYCEDGMNFRELLEESSLSMLGRKQCEKYDSKISILVKLLDAHERLPIQCHPTSDFAMENFGSKFGKTECWYILDDEPDAHVYLGFKEDISREKWERLFKTQDVEGMLNALHKHPVRKGDVFFVDGGIPHAIGSGCFLIELQEPSDLMVIPERITSSGIEFSDQKMHGGLGFDKMLDCFHYDGKSMEEIQKAYLRHPVEVENAISTIVGSDLTDKFEMKLLCTNKELITDLNDKYVVAIVIDGSGYVSIGEKKTPISKNDKFFIPAYIKDVHWCSTSTSDLKVVLCFPGE